MKWIQSLDNPLIKEIKKIKTQQEGKIFFEGVNLIKSALDSNHVQIERVFVTEQFIEKNNNLFQLLQSKKFPMIKITEVIAKNISDTVTPQGIFAVANFKMQTIDSLDIKNPTLIVIADRIQDPGNLGTIIRAGEALGADAVLLTSGTCNPYSTKVLRASTGSIFFIPVIKAKIKNIETFILNNKLNLVIADPHAKIFSFEMDFTKPLALIFGNEAQGVNQQLRAMKHASCKIPQKGKTESLNVAMSATVFLYEIFRQRFLKSV